MQIIRLNKDWMFNREYSEYYSRARSNMTDLAANIRIYTYNYSRGRNVYVYTLKYWAIFAPLMYKLGGIGFR